MVEHVFESAAACNEAVSKVLMAEFTAPRTGPTAVVLSGGRTPLPVYQHLAASGCKADEHLYILFADDRLVPATSQDSNYGHVLPMLNALNMPEERVVHIQPELGLEQAAAKYNRDLDAFLQHGRVALVLLGLGGDGHTCSLFSLEAAELKNCWAIPVEEQAGFERISVTADFLALAQRTIFHINGVEKQSIIQRLLTDPESIPAGYAISRKRSINSTHIDVFYSC